MVGRTPGIELRRLAKGLPGQVIAKLEMRNPAGNIKNRLGVALIEDSERRGVLHAGMTFIEPTGGKDLWNAIELTGLYAVRTGERRSWLICCAVPPGTLQEPPPSMLDRGRGFRAVRRRRPGSCKLKRSQRRSVCSLMLRLGAPWLL